MTHSPLFPLPLGRSGFPALREENDIYVDKTDLIYRLAKDSGKVLLTRPRRFGKSLLVSTLETLFANGLRDFRGLAIEKLWNDKTYQVVHLDFSTIKEFSSCEEFVAKLHRLLARSFNEIGASLPYDDRFYDAMSIWLKTVPSRSIVLLVDEYDAPLTACLGNNDLFAAVRSVMREFYANLKFADNALRFWFMTGVTKFKSTSIFSDLNNFTDISSNPVYGTLLGYTEKELKSCFDGYLTRAADELGVSKEKLIELMRTHYNGFCFDQFAKTRVYCPWSVLNFLAAPEMGFQNYWFESGGQPSVLLNYLVSHSLADPASYDKPQEVPLELLNSTSDYEHIDERVLLTQAGYLTIKSVSQDGWVHLGYPNHEVATSMARLYCAELLKGKRIRKPDGPSAAEVLAQHSTADIIEYFNWIFNSIDYCQYPVTGESQCRTILQVLLVGAGISAQIEKHTALGRSDLEVDAGKRHWVFEIKFAQKPDAVSELLYRARNQISSRRYGQTPHGKELRRVALVFESKSRKFAAWEEVPASMQDLTDKKPSVD